MASRLDVMMVGRTPLGSAMRAGLFGVGVTWISGWIFRADWQAAILGALIVIVALPVAYLISSRDNLPADQTIGQASAHPEQEKQAKRSTIVPPVKPDDQ